MSKKDFSLNGALVGGMAGWVAEVAIQEVTGHHVTAGILELLGAAAGMWRLDNRLARSLPTPWIGLRTAGAAITRR